MKTEPIITTSHKSVSVKELINLYETGKIEIPDYQRRYQYNSEQKNNLITSLILNLPVDSITCSENNGSYILCDGMHRIVTIRTFIKGGFRYNTNIGTAQKFGIDKTLHNKTFEEFPQDIKRSFFNRTLDLYITRSSEFSMERLVMNLMYAKNSGTMPMSKSRMALNEVMIQKEGVIDAWSILNTKFKCSFDEDRLARTMNRSAVTSMFKYLSTLTEDSSFMVKVVGRFIKTWDDEINDIAFNENQMSMWIQAKLIKSYLEECTDNIFDWRLFKDIYGIIRKYSASIANVTESNSYKIMAALYGVPPEKNCKVTKTMINVFRLLYDKPIISKDMKANIAPYLE